MFIYSELKFALIYFTEAYTMFNLQQVARGRVYIDQDLV